MTQRIIMSREIRYDDNSGARVRVLFDSDDRLGDANERFVRIQGVGRDDVWVTLTDVPFIIECLQAVLEADS